MYIYTYICLRSVTCGYFLCSYVLMIVKYILLLSSLTCRCSCTFCLFFPSSHRQSQVIQAVQRTKSALWNQNLQLFCPFAVIHGIAYAIGLLVDVL